VLSYSVAQRTREIGVRMAIGADRSDILQLILRQAAGATGIGICAGLLAGFLGARLINGLLFQTSSTDPFSLVISIAALVVVTLLAVSIPAVRAASVDPVVALRSE
jgi:putative ABC transport system permease protein